MYVKAFSNVANNWRKFNKDWKLATNKERTKWVLVTTFIMIFGVLAIYLLLEAIKTKDYNLTLCSYASYIVMNMVSKITAHKAKK